MIQRSQSVAAHQQHRQIQGGHQIQHVLALIERHAQAARAFQQQDIRRSVQAFPMIQDGPGQTRHIQARALTRGSQMGRGRQGKTTQHRRRSQPRQGRQIGHSRRVHRRVGLGRGVFLPGAHTGLHRLYSLGRHARQAQSPQQGRRDNGFAHIRPGAADKNGAQRATDRIPSGFRITHHRPPPGPEPRSWPNPLQCPARGW